MLFRSGALSRPWTEAEFLAALNDASITPQADPNTASHAQRVMKMMALKQLQAASPGLYDPKIVDAAALRAIGFPDPAMFFSKTEAPPDPKSIEAMAKANAARRSADAAATTAAARMLEARAKTAEAAEGADPSELALKWRAERTREKQIDFQQRRAEIEDANRDKDRAADLAIAELHAAGKGFAR